MLHPSRTEGGDRPSTRGRQGVDATLHQLEREFKDGHGRRRVTRPAEVAHTLDEGVLLEDGECLSGHRGYEGVAGSEPSGEGVGGDAVSGCEVGDGESVVAGEGYLGVESTEGCVDWLHREEIEAVERL